MNGEGSEIESIEEGRERILCEQNFEQLYNFDFIFL